MIIEEKLLIIIKKYFYVDIGERFGYKCNSIGLRGRDTKHRPVLEIQFQQKKVNQEHRKLDINIVKESPTKEHQAEIFNIYQGWINSDFSINVDLKNFDTNNLLINIVNLIAPKYSQTGGMNMTSLQDKSISHLNCNEYRDTYNKFNKILNLQKDFNDSMKKFLDKHKNRIKKIVKTENFIPTEESLNMFLRFIFIKSIAHDQRPSAVGWELENFRSFKIFVDNISEEKLEIFNPFSQNEPELIDYLKRNYDEIIESIEIFENDIIKIPKAIEEFKTTLQLIFDNKIDGLKGECDTCIKLNSFKPD